MGKNLTRAELVLDTKSVNVGSIPAERTSIWACTQVGEEE